MTKRTTKYEKIEKSFTILKLYDIINFKTIRNKLSASGKINDSFLNYKLMGPVSCLQLPKEYKKCRNSKFRKKIEREVSKPLKNELFSKKSH